MKKILPGYTRSPKQVIYTSVATSLLLFISVLLFSQANTWRYVGNDINVHPRFEAVSFSIGSKGYMGTGRDDGHLPSNPNFNDFWEFDPERNVWSQKADVPGFARSEAIGFSIGDKGYIGFGHGSEPPFVYNDFWEYDKATDGWTQRTSFINAPMLPRARAVGFSIGGKGYVGTGGITVPVSTIVSTFLSPFHGLDFVERTLLGSATSILAGGVTSRFGDFWEYDPSSHIWTKKSNFGGTTRDGAIGFSIGNKGYVGTGSDANDNGNRDDFWEYDPAKEVTNNAWTQKTKFPRVPTSSATGFSIGRKGYVSSGPRLYEYNPTNNAWAQRADLPKSWEYATSFSIGSKGYEGFGKTSNDFYEYTPYPEIYNTSVSAYSAGVGSTVAVKFTAYGGFNPGNTFSVQLSNADGNFTSSPPVIGSAAISIGSNDTGGTINAIIPVNTAMGKHYRVRIASSDPVGLSDDNGTDINIYAVAAPNKWIRMGDYGGGARFAATGFSIGSKGYMGTGIAGDRKKDFWEFDPVDNVWTQKADFGGTARSYATGFSIGSKGYIGTGLDVSGVNRNDFWEFDTAGNAWTQIPDLIGAGRSSAVAFSIGNKGYVGTGTGFNDFFEYDPASRTWTKKANFGGGGRSGAAGFSIGSKGYIGTGAGAGTVFKNDFWEYDPATDVWTQKANFGGTPRRYARGLSIDSKGYIGTGDDNSGIYKNDFWEYDPSADAWTQRSNFGGEGRVWATGFNIGSKGYIGTGPNAADFWEYTPAAPNSWVKIADYGGGARFAATGFSIGSKGYMGTGIAGDRKKDFWEFDPVDNVWTQKADFGGTARSYAAGFSIGNKGYIGTGLDVSGVNRNDFWKFDTAGNAWTQIPDLIGAGRSSAVAFSIGNKGYVGTGTGFNDFFEYDPASRTWTKKANFGGGGRSGAAGFSIGSKGYIGTGAGAGTVFKNDFWEYNPATDTWTQRADFAAGARRFARGFSIGSRGYFGTGVDNAGINKNDFWEYDPCANEWIQRNNFGGEGRVWATGFSIGNKGYIGAGPNAADFWEYTPAGVKPASPLVKTKNITVYLNAGGTAAIDPKQVDNGSVSYCGGLILTLDKTSFGCDNIGANSVKLTATDGSGNAGSGTAIVKIADNIKPVITNVCAAPNILWPPDNKMRKVTVNYTATDNCSVTGTFLSVTSNEPQCGSSDDWIILDNHHLLLRAERSKNNAGRIYTITITARDASCNTSTRKVTVTVPCDKSGGSKEERYTVSKRDTDDADVGLSVQAMPNPSQHFFTLITHSNSDEPITINITDAAGRVMEVRRNLAAGSSVQLGHEYKSGTYFVQVVQGKNRTTITLFKKAD